MNKETEENNLNVAISVARRRPYSWEREQELAVSNLLDYYSLAEDRESRGFFPTSSFRENKR